MPWPVPIGDPNGMTAAQPTSCSRRATTGVVGGVGQDGETVIDELLGGVDELEDVGEQRALVGHDLELHPASLQRLADEPCGEDRLRGTPTARRVR